MNQSDIERFDAYLRKEMDSESRNTFETKLSTEPAYAEAFANHLKFVHAIEEQGFRNMVVEISKDQAGHSSARPSFLGNPWFLSIAAAILVLISWVWLSSPKGEAHAWDEIAAIQIDPGLPTTLGSTDNVAFGEGMIAYKLGNYSEVLKHWKPLMLNDPDNDTLLFYVAQIDLAQKQYVQASAKLEPLTKREASIFGDKSRWYLALTKLRLEEEAEAKELLYILSQGESRWTNQAKTILEAM